MGLATVIVKTFLAINARSVARKTNNIAIGALVEDHRNIFASSGAAVGILLGLFAVVRSCCAIVAILLQRLALVSCRNRLQILWIPFLALQWKTKSEDSSIISKV
jgi:divalent metal cation (Fe/Co/Zn/Cd) transporter